MTVSILFIMPTIFMILVYRLIGIYNYFELFLFLCTVILSYSPGLFILYRLTISWMGNKVKG